MHGNQYFFIVSHMTTWIAYESMVYSVAYDVPLDLKPILRAVM